MARHSIPHALAASHRVVSAGRLIKITLNKPDDFIYDTGEIRLVWDPESGRPGAVECDGLPDWAVQSMLAGTEREVSAYVAWLEGNLSAFCAGKGVGSGSGSTQYGTAQDSNREYSNTQYGRDSQYSNREYNNKGYSNNQYDATQHDVSQYGNLQYERDTKYERNTQYERDTQYNTTQYERDSHSRNPAKNTITSVGAFPVPLHTNIQTPNVRLLLTTKSVLLAACKSIRLMVSCVRCGAISKVESGPDGQGVPGGSGCLKCATPLSVTYVPTVISRNSHSWAGFISVKKCLFVGFEPVELYFTCSECSLVYRTGPVGRGQGVHSHRCHGCTAEMRLILDEMVYIEKKSDGGMVQPGKELPEKGTCKHYKKSYRWFRFSCCNSLYPCDECHNAQAGHKAEEAKRMVCGLCSKEQSVKPECECGMSLRRKHSQFWEGGKGNRDRGTMSRRESKKYRK